MDWPKRVDPPDEPWMHRLRPEDKVWLVKEGIYGVVELPWQSNKLAFRKLDQNQNRYLTTEVWWVMPDGSGLDGRPLMDPTEGNLGPENDAAAEALDTRMFDKRKAFPPVAPGDGTRWEEIL